MPFHSGFIDPTGQPRLRIRLVGVRGRAELEPIVDTGFAGFLSIPILEARRLGIQPYTHLNCIFADGRTRSMPIGVGNVELSETETYRGTTILSEAADALLGMEFFRQAQKALYLDRQSVVLMDKTDIRELRRKLSSTDG